MMAGMKRRCVVTGQDANGKAVFVSDDLVDGLQYRAGGELHRLWGSDEAPVLPLDGSRSDTPGMFPPPGGYRFVFTTMAPRESRDVPATNPEMGVSAADLGVRDLFEKDSPGMHTTDTVDFDYIVSGEVYLELDDGAEVHLTAGDSVVMNGTRHAWRNRGSEPVVMLAVCIGAARSE
jgi:mannose-6-phosphate isomerase-like protein (cupin superfamily)